MACSVTISPERISAFDIKISTGAGAFVCGESTALMASLEGNVGTTAGQICPHGGKGISRQSVQPEQCGNLCQCTCHSLKRRRMVCRHGHRSQQRNQSFQPGGQDKKYRPGGSSHGDFFKRHRFRHGRRGSQKEKFKAVQTGGPSGGCIPERFLDLPVDYRS